MKKLLKTMLNAALLMALSASVGTLSSCGSNGEKATGAASVSETAATTYTVTFESNGGSAVASQKVEEGQHATEPEDPSKSGYTFNGWYAESGLTNLYDFVNATVSSDITLYAGWDASATGGDTASGVATFYWNYDYDNDGTKNNAGDVYNTTNFNYGSNISKVTDPTRDGYKFSGWYLADGSQYNRLSKYTQNVDVYAKWVIEYTFEAEDTQFTGLDYECEENQIYDTVTEGGLKNGVALSGSSYGTAMIHDSLKASGGKYVAGIDYKGAYLDFEFTSDEDETGVALSMRLSARFRSLTMSATNSTYRVDILVNKEAISYSDITIEREVNAQDMDGGDCEDYFKTFFINNINVKKGNNLIRIYVNNNNSRTDGTVRAMAPVVDCIYLSAGSKLDFTEYANK